MMIRRLLTAAACVLIAGPVAATSVSDCEGVVAQFEDHVARRGLGGPDQAALLGKLADAASPGAPMSDRVEKLAEFRERARTLEMRGDVSRFDSDRLARGAEVAMLCLQRVREGR
jgi:hypothetical protein